MSNNKNDIPSIHDLHKEKYKKEKTKTEIYTIVLNKCIERVVNTNRHTDKSYIMFDVPKILIGYPSYDMESCILFIMNELSNRGYLIEFIHPHYLYIDWGSNDSIDYTGNKKHGHNSILKRKTDELLKKFPNTSKIEYIYEDEFKKNSSKKKKKKRN
jgi:hypothetical protein